MRYGMIGNGDVAHCIAAKLRELGHEVVLGSRKGTTFNDAAAFGERLFLSVQGIHAIDALDSIDSANLDGKILIDQANPYIYDGRHVSLDARWSGGTCLGEEIQKRLPRTRVVNTLNFIRCELMVNPQSLPGEVTAFYCGNDAEAKAEVNQLLKDFGWTDTMDIGDISMSRYTEMLGAVWPAILNNLGHMNWGFKLVR